MRHLGWTSERTRAVPTCLLLALLALLVAGVTGDARAQDSEADSTSSILQDRVAGPAMSTAEAESLAAAAMDSAAAPPDSMAAAPGDTLLGFGLLRTFSPTLRGEFASNVTRIKTTEEVRAGLTWRDGSSSQLGHGRSQTSYRQQDRDQTTSSYNASLNKTIEGVAQLDIKFRRDSSEDENRVGAGNVIRLEREQENAELKLTGSSDLVEGIRHSWAVRGQSDDTSQLNRGEANDRSLLKGGVTSVWMRQADDWKLTGRYGHTSESGERRLLDRTDNASASLDTLAALLDIDLGSELTLSLGADRIRFVEERLELARNSSGNIDTVGVAPDEKVGQERESRTTQRLSADLTSRLFGVLGLTGSASHEFTETQYVFSPQGIVQTGTDQLAGDAVFRYAEAGSLGASLSYQNRYDDRRTRDSDSFRGRESRRSYEANLFLDQKVMPKTDLALQVQQSLSQTVAEEVTNRNDRDQLVERLDAEVKSEAIPKVTLNLGTTLSRTREINISAERVGNNKEDTLVEVRGGYTFDPEGSLRIVQNYRLQIVFIDFFESDDRDQFNKQGQVRNDISYSFPWGPSLGVEYLLDFRKNGQRDLDQPYATVYRPTLERFDHRLTARVSVPWRGLKFTAQSRRGFLRETRGSVENDEDRAELSLKVTGTKSFWKQRATLSLDLERILQFGPRVREEQEDYWVANTSLEVAF